MNKPVNIHIDRENYVLTKEHLDVIKKQAMLFRKCQNLFNVDAYDFIEKFMTSELAKELDKSESPSHVLSIEQLGDSFVNSSSIEPLAQERYKESLYWIGYLYRSWAFMGTPSADIIKVAPVARADECYGAYHTMGKEEAILRFISDYRNENTASNKT